MDNFLILLDLDRWAIIVGLGGIIVGAIAAVRPIAMIGLANRRRAAALFGGGLSLAAIGVFAYDYGLCPRDVLCGRCSPPHQRIVTEPIRVPSPADEANGPTTRQDLPFVIGGC
jgi:hypothetical protein